MDKKIMENVFNGLWNAWLSREKKIGELDARYEQEPSEVLQGTIYDLCRIALEELDYLEKLVSQVYDRQGLEIFQKNAPEKRSYLQEIASKVMSARTK